MPTDPRLLLPASAVPFVPDGAPELVRCRKCGRVGAPNETLGGVIDLRCAYRCGSLDVETLIDLSAPHQRDGLPAWLDVLPWCLAVLGWPFAVYHTTAPEWIETDHGGTRSRVPDGLDLSGLSNDEATRAIVVAAIVARGKR